MKSARQAAFVAAMIGAVLIVAALDRKQGDFSMSDNAEAAKVHYGCGLNLVKAGEFDEAKAEFKQAAEKSDAGSGLDKAARAALAWLDAKGGQP